MPEVLCTDPRIISLSPLSATDATLGVSDLWLGTRTGDDGTATLTESFFLPQPMALWTTYHGQKIEATGTRKLFKVFMGRFCKRTILQEQNPCSDRDLNLGLLAF